MTRYDEPHEPGLLGTCDHNHCYMHNVDEFADITSYKACFECGHVYRTAQDLADAYNGAYPDDLAGEDGFEALAIVYYGKPVISVNGQGHLPIFACPLCAHDF